MAEPYRWSPQVEAQVTALPALGSAAFWALVEGSDRSSPMALRAETLVVVLRRLKATGDQAGVQRVATALVLGWDGWMQQRARRLFPRSPDDRADFCSALVAALLDEVLDPSETFWEANFVHALTCLAVDVARPFLRMQRVIAESRLPYGDDDSTGPSVLEIADPSPGPEDAAFVQEALGLLDEPERTAVYLHVIEEWPVVNARGGPSVSQHLGVSDRTVRTYLHRGLSKLRAHYTAPGAMR